MRSITIEDVIQKLEKLDSLRQHTTAELALRFAVSDMQEWFRALDPNDPDTPPDFPAFVNQVAEWHDVAALRAELDAVAVLLMARPSLEAGAWQSIKCRWLEHFADNPTVTAARAFSKLRDDEAHFDLVDRAVGHAVASGWIPAANYFA